MNQKPGLEKLKVFLDASCWVAAAGSSTGGSALILELARHGFIHIIAIKRVLQEAERNIKDKLGKEALLRYYEGLGTIEIDLVDPPTPEEEARWRHLVAEKDCHILAGAYGGLADVLVSLDRRHILTRTVKEGFPLPVKDTSSFLRELPYFSGQ
ncbi:MAG: putative toxin-antitoxin system toxin component, PIN family [Syntrophothermus sp.]